MQEIAVIEDLLFLMTVSFAVFFTVEIIYFTSEFKTLKILSCMCEALDFYKLFILQ